MTSFNFLKIKFTGKGTEMNEVNLIRIQNSIFTSSNSRVRTFRYSLSSRRKFLLTFTLLTQISEIQVQSNFEDKVNQLDLDYDSMSDIRTRFKTGEWKICMITINKNRMQK